MEEQTQPKEAEPLKLPSKAELLKNPMKYIEVAIGQFQALSERVENTEKAIMILAESNKQLEPLVELAKTVKQRQAQAQASGQTNIAQGRAGIVEGLLTKALMGGVGEMSSTDKYFMRVGMDTVGLGHELYKSFIKEMVPQVIERWNKRKQELGLDKKE